MVEGADSVTEVSAAGLKKRPNGSIYRLRRWYKIPGLAPPSKLGVYNNNLENGNRAFAERYFKCKTENGFEPALPVSPDFFVSDVNFRRFLSEITRTVKLSPVATPHAVVNAYTGPKRALYARALDDYYRNGLTSDDAHLSSFVKFEKQDLSKAPRVINPRSTKFNLVLGKYLKLNEHAYFEAIAEVMGQEHTVIKGMDIKDSAGALQGLWDDFDEPVCVGGDASKFDMHVSRPALEYEHLFYLLPYHGGTIDECLADYRAIQASGAYYCTGQEGFEELAWLLSKQLDNVGTAYFDDGKLSFRMKGTRASGDLNTSLGNCVIMCSMSKVWSWRTKVKTALGNNGDDCVTVMETKDLQTWLSGQCEFYAACGFRMQLEEPVYNFEEVEFCQSRPVLLTDGYHMIRNPQTLVTKASMCLHPISTLRQLRQWMMAVGVCEGALSEGVPVIGSFARAMRRNGLKASKRLVNAVRKDSSRARSSTSTGVTDETRLSFFLAWGITPADQLHLERYYDEWQLGTKFGEYVIGSMALEKDQECIAPVTELLRPHNY